MPPKRGKTVKHHSVKRHARSRKQSKVLTIPEVRSSLKHISDYTASMVRSGKATGKSAVRNFVSEWKRVFGKKISYGAAKSYLSSMTKHGRTTRKMRGGNGGEYLLSGSPILDMTRPGMDLPHIKPDFPPYLTKFSEYPQPGIQSSCGTQQGILPQAGMGSNAVMKGGRRMKGGGLLSGPSALVSAAMFRPFVGQNPSSNQANLMTAWKGLPSPPGPESWQKTWDYRLNPSNPPPISNILTYNRDLTNDIKIP
jgi:hypothetical protein